MITDIPAFIRANTRVLNAPHVPELKLHLADDAVALWEMTEEELGQIGLPPPFWAFAWAGGQALARYLLDNPQIARGTHAFDIACGCGIVSIAALKVGAASALAMDVDAFATEASKLNGALNGVGVAAQTGDAIAFDTDADLILVGDFFYERELAAAMFARLAKYQAQGRTVLIGDPGRTYLPKDKLEQVASYIVPVTRALEDAEVKHTSVWRLRDAP
jgi:predicted nicotinamide N-methyase